jgi:hypothetical protein
MPFACRPVNLIRICVTIIGALDSRTLDHEGSSTTLINCVDETLERKNIDGTASVREMVILGRDDMTNVSVVCNLLHSMIQCPAFTNHLH